MNNDWSKFDDHESFTHGRLQGKLGKWKLEVCGNGAPAEGESARDACRYAFVPICSMFVGNHHQRILIQHGNHNLDTAVERL
jgi:hypothetical protein